MKSSKIVFSTIVVAVLCICATAQNQPSPLRLALNDLIRTYGKAYPRGTEFLTRLNQVEKEPRSKADYEKLQRKILLSNPLITAHPIVFVVRSQYRSDHHNTETMFENGQYIDGCFTPGGALKLIDFSKGGKVTTLIELTDGVIRDPEVHFSGKNIIFSMRKNKADSYHIYEINADGSGLRQITSEKGVSDIDPIYLPDGRIAFASTRNPKICPCNRHVVCNLFAAESDGSNARQISNNTLFDAHPSLMPDGRIIYDRWEYVDRAFGDAQAIWTANPDGTGHALVYGNNTPSPGGEIEPRVIPGTDRIICTLVPCHDRPWGAIGIIDRNKGTDGRAPIIKIWPDYAMDFIRDPGTANEAWDLLWGVRHKYEDPYPLNDKYFLCSRMTGNGEQMGIYLLDIFGNEILLHTEGPGCFDPMPLRSYKTPPSVPDRRDYGSDVGKFYIQNVYLGTHMKGVEPGSVKYLRVVEVLPKINRTVAGWGGQGIECPGVNWHDFMCKQILGTVPVEADGSAFVSVPSGKFVYFQLLDKDKMMIQSMRSGAFVQSGERTGCIGCHENRLSTPPAKGAMPVAFHKSPVVLDGWYGSQRHFNYLAEIQPIFDKHCVRCHDFGKHAGRVLNLARDKDFIFNASYNELWRKGYIKVVGAGPADIQQPYSWGSHASKLIATIKKGHNHVSLSNEEMDRLITWVDINAPYYPDYATAYPNNLAGRSPLDNNQLGRLGELTRVNFGGIAAWNTNPGPMIAFDRPELSPCLSSISDKTSDAYKEALAIIQAGQGNLNANPDCDMPGFKPSQPDADRLTRYNSLAETEKRSREAISKNVRLRDGN